MQQPSTTHYISIRQEAGAFLKVVFSMKDPKCVNQTATQRSSCPGQKSRNQLDIKIYSLNLTQRQAQILEKWSESFQGAIADVLAQWCHHKMSFILVPYELLWFCIIISYVSVWSYVFGVASSGSTSCSSFRIHFLFLELSGPFRWTHLMRMWVWLFGNIYLSGLSCRVRGSYLSLRKATKLHLWTDRGVKCHKQLLHRQPAVTVAVEPVAQPLTDTFERNMPWKI